MSRIEIGPTLVALSACSIVLLRRPVVSGYLILSALLSYFTTLGATFAFVCLLHAATFTGLDWKVPIFLFTILVAVGEDYNIFLVSRIREEKTLDLIKSNASIELT